MILKIIMNILQIRQNCFDKILKISEKWNFNIR